MSQASCHPGAYGKAGKTRLFDPARSIRRAAEFAQSGSSCPAFCDRAAFGARTNTGKSLWKILVRPLLRMSPDHAALSDSLVPLTAAAALMTSNAAKAPANAAMPGVQNDAGTDSPFAILLAEQNTPANSTSQSGPAKSRDTSADANNDKSAKAQGTSPS